MNLRLFVAIDFPNQIKDELQEIAFSLPGARWTRKENLHLTLQFIGEVNESQYDEIKDSLSSIQLPGFSLTLKDLGFFSRGKIPKILWIGVDNAVAVMELQKKIARSLRAIGIKLESRKFSAHITLARLNDTSEARLGQYLSQVGLFKTSTFPVDQFCLFSSKLTPKGAVYTIESKYDLPFSQLPKTGF